MQKLLVGTSGKSDFPSQAQEIWHFTGRVRYVTLGTPAELGKPVESTPTKRGFIPTEIDNDVKVNNNVPIMKG